MVEGDCQQKSLDNYVMEHGAVMRHLVVENW